MITEAQESGIKKIFIRLVVVVVLGGALLGLAEGLLVIYDGLPLGHPIHFVIPVLVVVFAIGMIVKTEKRRQQILAENPEGQPLTSNSWVGG